MAPHLETHLETLIVSGRRIYSFDSAAGGATSELVEDDDGRRYLVWGGPSPWVERVEALLAIKGKLDGLTAIPELVHRIQGADQPTLILKDDGEQSEPFDVWRWRNLPARTCVSALQELAVTVHKIHRAGWTMDGLSREELLFDASSKRLFIGAIHRLRQIDDEQETIWRDLRLFGELAYENFLEHEYPGGHQLVAILQDRSAMAEAGITIPGLSQLLAGCVTPYGDLAFSDVNDLLQGLDNLLTELTPPLTYRVGSRSTLGNHIFRQNNQDSCGHAVVDTICASKKERFGFFCVADGIGGIQDGERASSMAVRAACRSFLRAWNHYDGEVIQNNAVEFARSIAQVTSQRLVMEGDFAPQNNRGGTTFTGLLLAGRHAAVCHAGDSRAVLIRDSELLVLTQDHTLASIMEKLGEPTSSDEDDASHRTIARFFSTATELSADRVDGFIGNLSEKLGLTAEEINLRGIPIQQGDIFILTSDGAHGEVDERDLRRMVPKYADDPQALCNAIIDVSLQNIGRDNATAMVVFVE